MTNYRRFYIPGGTSLHGQSQQPLATPAGRKHEIVPTLRVGMPP
jgi:hypothetical protein